MWSALVPAAAAAALALWWVVGLRPGARRRHSREWIRRQHAPITTTVAQEVEAVRWRARTVDLAGMLVAACLCTAVAVRVDATSDDSYFGMLAFGLPLLLIFVASSVVTLLRKAWHARGPRRVARAWKPRLTDYVSRSGLVAIRLYVVVILTAVVASLVALDWDGFGFGPDQSGRAWIVLAIVVLSLGGAEVVAHRLLSQPLRSGDPLELFWRDALRADDIRAAYRLPMSVVFLVSVLMTDAFPRSAWQDDRIGTAAITAMPILILLGIPVMVLLDGVPTSRHRSVALAAARQTMELV